MASWNSVPLEITYQVLGWTSFLSWTMGFYPQVILNFRRKSVVGMSFDFVVLNFTKHSSYLIYNVSLFFIPTIQKQYYEKYGYGEMIPVAANDVAFSTHAVLVTTLLLFQIVIYERGSQKVSKIAIAIISAVWLFATVCFFIALPSHSWLWLISTFNSIQVFMTVIKYIPQMVVQSIDQGSLVNFYGNEGKVLLSLVSMSFDIIFMCQRFVFYPVEQPQVSPKLKEESREPLVKCPDRPHSENV